MTPEYFDIQSTLWDNEKKCKRAKLFTRAWLTLLKRIQQKNYSISALEQGF